MNGTGQVAKTPSWIRLLLVSLAINGLFFGIFFICFTPGYETNDDVGMMLTASGVWTGQPSEYLIFTNVIIGKALKAMYMRVPGINWYPYYLFLAHFLGMTVILYGLFRMKYDKRAILLYSGMFVLFEMPLLMKLQFTSTACVLALSGICLLISSIGLKSGSNWPSTLLSALLLAGAGLIRAQSVFLIGLLSVPVLLLAYLDDKTKKIPVFAVLSLLLFGAYTQYNHFYYARDPAWKTFYEQSNIRRQLLGYPKYIYNERTAQAYEKIGWSKNDQLMFRHRYFFDQKIFSTERLELVRKNVSNRRSISETIGVLMNAVLSSKLQTAATLLFIMISMAFFTVTARKFIFFAVVPAVLICLYLSYSARLPYRVFMPLLLFLNASVIFFDHGLYAGQFNRSGPLIKIIIVAALCLIVILIPVNISIMNGQSKTHKAGNDYFKRQLRILPRGKDRLNIIWGGSALRLECTSPYSDLKEYKNINMFITGVLINSPINEKLFLRYGVKDAYLAFGENSNIYLVMNTNIIYRDMFSRHIMEHYGRNIEFRLIESYGNMGVYKILYGEKP